MSYTGASLLCGTSALCTLPSALNSTAAVSKCCTSGSSRHQLLSMAGFAAPLETWLAHFSLWYWGRDLQLKPNSSQPLLWWYFIRNPFARHNQGSFVSKLRIFATLLFMSFFFCTRNWCYLRNKVLNFCSSSSSFPMTLRPIFGPWPSRSPSFNPPSSSLPSTIFASTASLLTATSYLPLVFPMGLLPPKRLSITLCE